MLFGKKKLLLKVYPDIENNFTSGKLDILKNWEHSTNTRRRCTSIHLDNHLSMNS